MQIPFCVPANEHGFPLLHLPTANGNLWLHDSTLTPASPIVGIPLEIVTVHTEHADSGLQIADSGFVVRLTRNCRDYNAPAYAADFSAASTGGCSMAVASSAGQTCLASSGWMINWAP